MRWFSLLLALAVCAQADWKLGLWWELAPGRDSVVAKEFAQKLSADFDRRLKASGRRGAALSRLVLVDSGRLPLAGSDPVEHPDLRDSAIDLEWGIPANRPLPTPHEIEETWLRALGCPDPSTFAVGWDLFLLQENGKPLLGTPQFPLLHGLWAHEPSWKLVDSAVDIFCLRLAEADTLPHGPRLTRKETALARLVDILPETLTVSVRDAIGHPIQARVFLWHGRPDARRPYASLFDGPFDTLETDSSGLLRLSRERWFGAAPRHGRDGSNLQALVRTSAGGRSTSWRWIEPRDLVLDSGRLGLVLPAGESQAWTLASHAYPNGELIAAQSDTGAVWVGISLLSRSDVVLRVLEPDGRELFRSRAFNLAPGAWEKRLPLHLSNGSAYDLRLDTPISRRLVRFVAGAGASAR